MTQIVLVVLCGSLLGQAPGGAGGGAKKKSKSASTGQTGLIEYKGKKITIDRLREFAKTIPSQQLLNSKAYAKLIGSAIRIEGTLQKVSKSSWEVAFRDREDRPGMSLAVDAERFAKDRKVRAGMNVVVVGIVREGGVVEGYAWELLAPGLKWEYALQKPAAVVAGAAQTYVVKGRVANTGSQPFRRVLVAVRLYQVSSPNDTTVELVLREIAVGETRDFTVEFPTYNFQFAGATSLPRVQMAVVDYEL